MGMMICPSIKKVCDECPHGIPHTYIGGDSCGCFSITGSTPCPDCVEIPEKRKDFIKEKEMQI